MPEPTLDGLDVLVTRAPEQAAALAAAIRDAGGSPVLFPALEIEAVDKAEVARLWAAMPHAELVLFVSANAVRYGLAAIALDETYRIGAIGPATAEALVAAKLDSGLIRADGFDSEALLAAIDDSLDIDGKTVVIVRGSGGRELLARELEQRGASVHYLEVYRRLAPTADEAAVAALLERWERDGIDVTTVLSGETLDNLLALLGERGGRMFDRTPLVTPSRRVIQTLRQRPFAAHIERADGPDPAAIVAAIARVPLTRQDLKAMADTDRSDAQADTETTAERPQPDFSNVDTADVKSATVTDAAPPRRRSGTGGLIAALALVLAALAAAAAGLALKQARGVGDADLDALSQRIETLRDENQSLQSALRAAERSVSDLEGDHRSLVARVSRIANEASERADLVDSLPGRVENVESGLAAFEGIAAGTRSNWLKAEAEYYLQLANAQAQLARNPELAALGLSLADERVRALSDPRYTPVRRAIAEGVQQLKALGTQDHEGVSLTLAGLSQAVALLPLDQSVRLSESAEPTPAEEPTDGAVDRGLDSVKRVLSDLVRVRRSDEAVTPLMSPEAAYFLRTNLELKFDTARLALLRGEQTDYEQALDDAALWLGEYFDTDDEGVSETLETIAGLRQRSVVVELPDISEPLRLLREQSAIDELGAQ